MGKPARKKRPAGVKPLGASGSLDASAPTTPPAAGPAEPLERARLQAEVARQRVRIAKEELKRARKRVKEAKREAKRARRQAEATRKVWKKARKAHRAQGTPEASIVTARPRPRKPRTQRAKVPAAVQKAKGPALRRAKRRKNPRRHQSISAPPAAAAVPESQDGSGSSTPTSEA